MKLHAQREDIHLRPYLLQHEKYSKSQDMSGLWNRLLEHLQGHADSPGIISTPGHQYGAGQLLYQHLWPRPWIPGEDPAQAVGTERPAQPICGSSTKPQDEMLHRH